MDYRELIESARRHLAGQGIAFDVTAGRPVTEKDLAKAESRMKVRLPGELREFYCSLGDGVSSFWQDDYRNPKKYFGGLLVPGLADLVATYLGWRNMALYSSEEAEEYGFPHTRDPGLAKRTAARMWHWLPVFDESNGDLICHDLGDPSCPVIYHQHDWLDGGSGDGGHLLAPNWRAFLEGWGSVCFQQPESMFWPSCFRPGGGVDWAGGQFHDSYRVAGPS